MSTTTEQNKAVIRRFLEAWNNRQPEAFDGLIPRSMLVRHCQATPTVDVHSLDQLKEFLQQDTAIFPDSRQTIVHMVAEGDLVGVMGDRSRHETRPDRSAAGLKMAGRGSTSAQCSAWPTARSPSGGLPGTICTILRQLGHMPSV